MKKIFYILSAALFIGCSAPTPKGAQIEVLGHRGGRYETDENTLSAFVESYNNGVRSYETDIRLTADNELVISHDASLKRIFGVDVNVEQSNRADLTQYNSLKGHPVLFVDELAEFFGSKDIRYVEWEMKSGNYTQEQLDLYCDKLYTCTMASKPADALYIFSSFDERAILTMLRLHPEAEGMYLTSQPVTEEVIEKVKSLLLESAANHKLVFKDPAPFARLSVQNASSLDFVLRVWTKSSDYWSVYFDLNETIKKVSMVL